jgi:hypothetical protein
LFEVSGVGADLGVDEAFEGEGGSGRVFDGWSASEDHESGFVFCGFFCGCFGDEFECFVAPGSDGVGDIDVVDNGDAVAGADGAGFSENENEESEDDESGKSGPGAAAGRESGVSGGLHPPDPWGEQEQEEHPGVGEFEFADEFELWEGEFESGE